MSSGLGRTHETLGVLPALVVYLGLEWAGVSALVALGVSAAILATGLGWLAWRGRLTRIAVVSSVLFAAIATAVSVTGNLWLFLLKPVVTGLILGSVILANPGRGTRPYSLRILCRLRPRHREQLLRRFEQDPAVRRRHHTATKAWGVAIIADGLVRAGALLTLPPWLAVVTSMPLTIVTVAVGTSLSLRYLTPRDQQTRTETAHHGHR